VRLSVLSAQALAGHPITIAIEVGVALAQQLLDRLATIAINRIQLEAPGLYPLMALAFGLLAFGAAAVLGGSGFLGVYVA